MKKRSQTSGAVAFFLVWVVIAFCFDARAETSPRTEKETVSQVAGNVLPGLLRAAAADKKSYGFEARDEPTKAELGVPYQVFALSSSSVKSYKTSDAVTNLLMPAGEWIFPVQCNGSNRVVLIVRQTAKGWKAIYFGNGNLARQLGRLREQWAAKKTAEVTLVSLTEIRSFWFTVQPHAVENLTPLSDIKLPSGEVVIAPRKPLEIVPAADSVPKLAKALLEIEHQEKSRSFK